MQNMKSNTDPRCGWFKILIPDIQQVFGGLFQCAELDIELLHFMYSRLDPDQVSFDCTLSIPFLAFDRVVLVRLDKRPEAQQPVGPGEVGFPMQLIPLKLLAIDQENRCYLRVEAVTCIIPVDTRHPIVATLIQITSESGLIIPGLPGNTPIDPGRVIDMKTGQVIHNPPPGDKS